MWALYNSLKGWALYSLSDREVQLLVNSMTANEIRLVRICRSEDLVWKPLSQTDYPELFAKTGMDQGPFPSVETIVEADDTDTDYFIAKPKKVFYPRLHERLEKEFKASVLGTGISFNTITVDLSEGGLCFKDSVPEWVSGYFIVEIQDGGQKYSVMCSLVEDQKEKKRVQVVSEEADPQYLKYKNWLHAHLATSP